MFPLYLPKNNLGGILYSIFKLCPYHIHLPGLNHLYRL